MGALRPSSSLCALERVSARPHYPSRDGAAAWPRSSETRHPAPRRDFGRARSRGRPQKKRPAISDTDAGPFREAFLPRRECAAPHRRRRGANDGVHRGARDGRRGARAARAFLDSRSRVCEPGPEIRAVRTDPPSALRPSGARIDRSRGGIRRCRSWRSRDSSRRRTKRRVTQRTRRGPD